MSEIPINSQLQSILRPLEQVSPTNREIMPPNGPAQPERTADGKSFAELVSDSIQEVNRLQHQATDSLEQLATGESASIHSTVIELQKASISFQMMMEVRNKLVDAYREVMRTQI